MAESILTSIKTTLGLAEDYVVFDKEIILFINTVLADMHQLGVGPASGYAILDKDNKWDEFLGVVVQDDLTEVQNPVLNNVKSYVSMRVKMLFDPPEVGYVLTAYEKLIEQAEWRITVAQDEISRPVTTAVVVEDDPLPIEL